MLGSACVSLPRALTAVRIGYFVRVEADELLEGAEDGDRLEPRDVVGSTSSEGVMIAPLDPVDGVVTQDSRLGEPS